MDQLAKLIDVLRSLIAGRFYGSVEIKFEAGKIVVVRKEETIKL